MFGDAGLFTRLIGEMEARVGEREVWNDQPEFNLIGDEVLHHSYYYSTWLSVVIDDRWDRRTNLYRRLSSREDCQRKQSDYAGFQSFVNE